MALPSPTMPRIVPCLLSHRGALHRTKCYDAAEETMATTTRRATEEDLLHARILDGEGVESGFRCPLASIL